MLEPEIEPVATTEEKDPVAANVAAPETFKVFPRIVAPTACKVLDAEMVVVDMVPPVMAGPVIVGLVSVLLVRVTVLSSRTTMPVCPGSVIVQFPIWDFARNVQTLSLVAPSCSKKLM